MKTAVLALASALLVALPLDAQNPTLNGVDSLVALGQVQEARESLQQWWATEANSATRFDVQRGLWLRAILTIDPRLAEADFQRLVVGYPGGPYSDRALLRLGYAAHAQDDLATAATRFEAILRDYPDSPLRNVAETWMAEYGEAARMAEPAAPTVAQRQEAAPPEPESAAERQAEPRPVEEIPIAQTFPVEPEQAAQPSPGRSTFSVQLGAFSRRAGAERVAEQARAAGFATRLVRSPGSDLIRVRVGHFPDSVAANRMLLEVARAGLEAIVVGDADREQPVG